MTMEGEMMDAGRRAFFPITGEPAGATGAGGAGGHGDSGSGTNGSGGNASSGSAAAAEFFRSDSESSGIEYEIGGSRGGGRSQSSGNRKIETRSGHDLRDTEIGEGQPEAPTSELALELEIGEEWSKVSKPKPVKDEKAKGPKRKYSKRAKEAKIAIYYHIVNRTHKTLASILGPQAELTVEEARELATNYVICEEYYGWKSFDYYLPAVMLGMSVLSIEGRIVKDSVMPAIIGKKQTSKDTETPRSVPKLVKPA